MFVALLLRAYFRWFPVLLLLIIIASAATIAKHGLLSRVGMVTCVCAVALCGEVAAYCWAVLNLLVI